MKNKYIVIWVVIIVVLVAIITFMIIKIYNPFFVEEVVIKENKPDMPLELQFYSKDNVIGKAYLDNNYWKCKEVDGVKKCINDFKGIGLLDNNSSNVIKEIININSGNKILLDLNTINQEYLKDENKTVEYFIYDHKKKLVRKYNLQNIGNMAVIDTSKLIKGNTYYIIILLQMSNVVSTYILEVKVI